jgi:hypothetical protein
MPNSVRNALVDLYAQAVAERSQENPNPYVSLRMEVGGRTLKIAAKMQAKGGDKRMDFEITDRTPDE